MCQNKHLFIVSLQTPPLLTFWTPTKTFTRLGQKWEEIQTILLTEPRNDPPLKYTLFTQAQNQKTIPTRFCVILETFSEVKYF